MQTKLDNRQIAEDSMFTFFSLYLEDQIAEDVLCDDVSIAEAMDNAFDPEYLREVVRDQLLDDMTIIGQNGHMSPFGHMLDLVDQDMKDRFVNQVVMTVCDVHSLSRRLRQDYINRNLTFKKQGYNN